MLRCMANATGGKRELASVDVRGDGALLGTGR
jgi:hypothetical protein